MRLQNSIRYSRQKTTAEIQAENGARKNVPGAVAVLVQLTILTERMGDTSLWGPSVLDSSLLAPLPDRLAPGTRVGSVACGSALPSPPYWP